MKEIILDSAIWYIGAVVVFAAVTAVWGLLAVCAFVWCEASGRRLMRIIRFETARYWVLRMEREGLTIAQNEYRRMVKECSPKSTADFMELDRIASAELAKEHMEDES
jgi:hypothetical protein